MSTTPQEHALTIPYPFPPSDPDYVVQEQIHTELLHYLTQEKDSSPGVEAERLIALVISQEDAGDSSTYGFFDCLWTLILNAVEAISPEHRAQTKLVDLVLGMREVTIPFEGTQQKLWKYMPGFSEYVNYVMRGLSPGNPSSSAEAEIRKCEGWTSLNNFISSITAASDGKYEFLFYGLVAISHALEEPLSAKDFEYHVGLATTWISQCGHLLVPAAWSFDEDEDTVEIELDRLPTKVDLPPGSLLRDGSSDIGRPRWHFWIARLRALESGEGVDYTPEARMAAKRALEAMDKVSKATKPS